MDERTKFTLREMGRRAGWDDPSMDIYDVLYLNFDELSEAEQIARLQAFGRAAGWEDPEADIFDDLEPQ